jgi:hypothetical protein
MASRSAESTSEPIWLLQEKREIPLEGCEDDTPYCWETVSVEFSREDAERIAESNPHRYGKKGESWRVYCISLYDTPCAQNILRAIKKLDPQQILSRKKILENLSSHRVTDLESGFDAPPASGSKLLRVQKYRVKLLSVMDSEVCQIKNEVVGNIPEPKEDTFYIVSKRVADTLAITHPWRNDFVYPDGIVHEHVDIPLTDTDGKPLRYKDGTVVTRRETVVKGCSGFAFSERKVTTWNL